MKELQKKKRKKDSAGERQRRNENDHVRSNASGHCQAGPAKSNELIACRDPVGAAVL